MSEKKVYHVTFDMTDTSGSMSFTQKSKIVIRQFTEHIIVKIVIIVLILIDISVTIADIYNIYSTQTESNSERNKYEKAKHFSIIGLVLSIIFVIEVLLRIYGLGLKTFFNNWINTVDFCIVVLTFIINLVVSIVENVLTGIRFFVTLRLVFRLPRIFNLIRILANKNNYLNSSRYVTSQNKRRFRLDGFDLDLCYITDRVIAMSFPSSGLTALYRNSITDVAEFLNSRYGHYYKIYNLCEEKGYDTSFFQGQVERFMITDHNVPRLKELREFAEDARQWLLADERNVIAVHCKGGKGRTGTMICVLLIDTDLFDNAELCLQYFGDRRTDLLVGKKFQGVETPSQSRYVGYFQQIKSSNYIMPATQLLKLDKIILHGVQEICGENKSDLSMKIIHGNTEVENRETDLLELNFNDESQCQVKIDRSSLTQTMEIILLASPVLSDDIKLKFYSSYKKVSGAYDSCSFFLWFNTNFIEDNLLSLTREQIDNPHKKSAWKIFDKDFKLEIHFVNVQ